MPQSMAAELKAGPRTLAECLPQLWFGRTPWLIRARHGGGLFHQIDIANVAKNFRDWETKHQDALRKLVTVLSQLREGVRLAGGGRCVAIFERGSHTRMIRVFTSTKTRQVLPQQMLSTFWARVRARTLI